MTDGRDLFKASDLKTVRGKYYKKADVDSLLADICTKAELQSTQNELLQMKLDSVRAKIAELEEIDRKNGILPEMLLKDAEEEVRSISEEAEKRREEILEENRRNREQVIVEAGESLMKLKEQYESNIETVNTLWQEFLQEMAEE